MKKLLLLAILLITIGCTQQENECECYLDTYEYWNDGSIDHWKPYSSIEKPCGTEIEPTVVKELENGHQLKVLLRCE